MDRLQRMVMEGAMVDKNKQKLTLDALDFIRHNIYNVSDITRKNKLTEILKKFSQPTDEVFIIENAKNKGAKGALIDLNFFEELLRYKESVDQAADQLIEKEAIKRIESGEADKTIPLDKALSDDDIDWDLFNKEINK